MSATVENYIPIENVQSKGCHQPRGAISPSIVRCFLFNNRVAYVRFGSEADVTPMNCDVCFTSESGH